MKKLALALLILAVLAAGFTLWGYAGARLSIQALSARELPPEEYGPRFIRLREQLSQQSVRGLVYGEALSGGAEDYKILEYTLRADNRGLVDARMLEALVVPLKGDILCYSQQEAMGQDVNNPLTVKAGDSFTFKVYLLTGKDAHAVRDIQVSYYIWGNPFILTARYG